MEPNEPQAALYDFLYKDNERIASYYAQLFRGRLTSLEESDQLQDSQERTMKLSVKVVEYGTRTTEQNQTGQKRVIDPHDLVTTDVLTFFAENNKLQADAVSAQNSALIIAKGALVLIDPLIFEGALIAYEEHVKQMKKLPKNKVNQGELQAQEIGMRILSKFRLPSAFLLQADTDFLLAGVIKEASLNESISSYYVKHGANGLADVHLIGIKEESTSTFTLPVGEMFGVSKVMAQALTELLFPPEAIRVTPLALFRKL